MLLLRTDKLPEGTGWQYEVKLDGYRAQAIKTGGRVQLRSRNAEDFTTRYPGVVAALAGLPDETVVDGQATPQAATFQAGTLCGAHPGIAQARPQLP